MFIRNHLRTLRHLQPNPLTTGACEALLQLGARRDVKYRGYTPAPCLGSDPCRTGMIPFGSIWQVSQKPCPVVSSIFQPSLFSVSSVLIKRQEEYAQQKHHRWGGYEDVLKIFQMHIPVQLLGASCSLQIRRKLRKPKTHVGPNSLINETFDVFVTLNPQNNAVHLLFVYINIHIYIYMWKE